MWGGHRAGDRKLANQATIDISGDGSGDVAIPPISSFSLALDYYGAIKLDQAEEDASDM
jgi:hypothetical protein